MSAPTLYFDFPGFEVSQADLRELQNIDVRGSDVILGGGGLLDEFFLSSINRLRTRVAGRRLIFWGVGQQVDHGRWWEDYKAFPYSDYLREAALLGIRDFNTPYPWVPCASCMHPAFDRPKEVKHEFVIFSHRTRPVPIQGFPTLRNDESGFSDTIDFLASGDTVITSSYHGMYWALLLGRKILAFPFNSKFFMTKYPVTLYPAVWQKTTPVSRGFRRLTGRSCFEYTCQSVGGWRIAAGSSRAFPEALKECRDANRAFYREVVALLVNR